VLNIVLNKREKIPQKNIKKKKKIKEREEADDGNGKKRNGRKGRI
jgi:hypothetical protein